MNTLGVCISKAAEKLKRIADSYELNQKGLFDVAVRCAAACEGLCDNGFASLRLHLIPVNSPIPLTSRGVNSVAVKGKWSVFLVCRRSGWCLAEHK